MMQVILNTVDLGIGYKKGSGDKAILKHIDVELVKGELVCLIGPNGVGKSTLLRTLCGVQKPLDGKILLNGKNLLQYDRQRLALEVSLVLTEKVVGNLTVHELISLGRYPHTDWTGNLTMTDEEQINKAIADSRCEGFLHQKVYEISDGQMQKAMIARAFAQDGNLMILDEPSAHLDLKNKVEILTLLQKLAKTHQKAILIATHELDLAMLTADRLWLMDYDKPLLSGTPEDLALSGHISAAFQSDGFKLDPATGKIKIVKEKKGSIKVEGKGKEFYWTCHALERCGFAITKESERSLSIVEGKWNLVAPGFEKSLSTIDQVIRELHSIGLKIDGPH